ACSVDPVRAVAFPERLADRHRAVLVMRRKRGRVGAVPGTADRRAATSVGAVRGHRWTLLDPDADARHVRLTDGFLLEQLLDDAVEDVAVLDQDLPRLVVREFDERAHLTVDLRRDRLGVVPLVAHRAAEE